MKRLLCIVLLTLVLGIILFGFILAVDSDASCGFKTTRRHTSTRIAFLKLTGYYPNGRKGYVVDHIIPLCKGGPDTVANMQWQTVAAAKAKDKIECRCSPAK